jgi:phosphoribosylformimino-5-aminoimidazole carboxamide ribotide isomerase
MDSIQIRDTPLEIAWAMRKEVMYPGETIDFVKLEDDNSGMHWGLYVEDQIVSVISVFERNRVIQFRKFATTAGMQRKGYGTSLLHHVIDWAHTNGMKCVWCNARKSAAGFYEKFGMIQNGPGWEKNGIEFIKMEKNLVQDGDYSGN